MTRSAASKARRQESSPGVRKQPGLPFFTIPENNVIPLDDPLLVTDGFTATHTDTRVVEFVGCWAQWVDEALAVMSNSSHPNINMQQGLAKMVRPHIGRSVLDMGAGSGALYKHLFLGGDTLGVKEIIATDISAQALRQIPDELHDRGYRQRVALVQEASWSPSCLFDDRVDTILANLGGITYSGWRYDLDGNFICEGRRALEMCLADVFRILKPGGYLAFSTLVDNPNFGAVLRDSLLSPLWPPWSPNIKAFLDIAKHGIHIKHISQFLHEAAKAGHAHYLPLADWQGLLSKTGFSVEKYSYGRHYAGQGAIFLAKKPEQ